MFSKRSQEGYLVIDHRVSPGGSLVMGGQLFESPTITCSHCHRVVILRPDRSRSRGYCRKCDHYLCDSCTGSDCKPFVQVLDELENQIRHNESMRQ